MFERKFPSVQELSFDDYFPEDYKFKLTEAGYRIAFTFEDRDGKRLDDPKYVKILARLR